MFASLFPVPETGESARWLAYIHPLRDLGLTKDFTLARQDASERFPASLPTDWLANSYRTDPCPAADALGEEWFEFAVEKGVVVKVEGGWLSPLQQQMLN